MLIAAGTELCYHGAAKMDVSLLLGGGREGEREREREREGKAYWSRVPTKEPTAGVLLC
jgi:hypothetical protein